MADPQHPEAQWLSVGLGVWRFRNSPQLRRSVEPLDAPANVHEGAADGVTPLAKDV